MNYVIRRENVFMKWRVLAESDVMKLRRFSFSDACSNIDTDFDVRLCFCKRWGILCINKLLIC